MLTLEQFKIQRTWLYQMTNSKGLDSFNNYIGEPDPTDHWIVIPCSRNRDSEILEESNFSAALDMLGGEGKNVVVRRSGHWGCGWFEIILVNPKIKSKLNIAYQIYKLLQEYPVLDDSDYSERENEYRHEYAEGSKEDLAEALAAHFNIKNSKSLVTLAYTLQIENQIYFGNDSCVNIYTSRKPDLYAAKDLLTVIDSIYCPTRGTKKLLATLKANVTECLQKLQVSVSK